MRKIVWIACAVVLLSCGGKKHDVAYYEQMVDSIRRAEQVKLLQHEAGIESDPVKANRQNVTFRFTKVFKNDVKRWQLMWPVKHLFKKKIDSAVWADNIKTNRNHCEENEVDDIRWIPLEDIDKYKWAFGHDELIKEIAAKNGLM